ncbi:MAG: hypothetical protein HYZ42_07520 [Bacteroidetes bacterium]|nr:hypothetical protein [Bacteroidota bacterium]
MKKKIYSIVKEEQTLIYEESSDGKGNILYYKDLQADPIAEKFFEYNESGNVIKETDMEGGIETSRTETEYIEGKISSIKLYISQEIYEETQMTYIPNGHINTHYINGEETGKVIFKNTVNGSEEISYINDELQYKILTVEENRVKKVFVYNENDELVTIEEINLNPSGDETLVQLYDNNRKLLNEYICTYSKGLLAARDYIDYMETKNNCTEKFEYDHKKNLIHSEDSYPNQYKVEFQTIKYDAYNRIVEESGITTGSEHIYMTHFMGVGFHLIHEYE